MAEAYLETTVWADTTANINHTYYLEGDRMLAYIRYGTSEPYWFKQPITISRSGRKFQRVDAAPFENSLGGLFLNLVPQPVEPKLKDPEVLEVQGSQGAVYLVNIKEQTCTCPGYTYRGACKHVKELENA